MNDVLFAFTLTLLAGAATAIGGVFGVAARVANRRFLATSLGFSAGVMIYVSLVELLPQGQELLTTELGQRRGDWAMVASFFGGIAVAGIIDRLVPEGINPHEPRDESDVDDPNSKDARLLRAGLITALAVGLHNFPEGFATFMTALKEPRLAIPVAIAIAIHNVPEGIAVAVPIHHATGNRWRAFTVATLSGVAEPVGAMVGYLLLRPFLTDAVLGVVLAAVAGIMVFISLDELLPTAEKYGKHHWAIYGLVAGMATMAISLVLLS